MKKGFRLLALTGVLAGSLVFTSCGSSSKKNEGEDMGMSTEAGAPVAGAGDLQVGGDSDTSRAGGLQTVYFEYDSSQLSSDARRVLDENAATLKEKSNIEAQVEGHCDERGGIEYNLALGERRAKTIKDYLIALGVAANRISTVSYGKERPLEFGHAEGAWSRNRRGNFVVTNM